MQGASAAATRLLISLICWLTLYPLSLLVPRRKGLWLFVGREHGKFLDNVKHMFARVADTDGVEAVFISEDRELCGRIRVLGADAAVWPGLRAAWLLARAEVLFVDSVDWPDHGRGQLAQGAKLVQMWHGIPLKEIELAVRDRLRARLPAWLRPLFDLYRRTTLRHPEADWLASTSPYMTERVFASSIRHARIIESGYPRNDILFGRPEGALANKLIDLNVDADACERIEAFKRQGGKCLLYAPTFRKHMHSPFDSGALDLRSLGEFLAAHDLLLAVKLHPLMSGRLRLEQDDNLLWIEPDSDIYPVLPIFDLLITDYSSIYFDFLLLDKGIVFFSYDLGAYLSDERKLFFDYGRMTPGPKCTNQAELQEAVLRKLRGDHDAFAEERRVLRDLAFSHCNGLAARRVRDRVLSMNLPG